MFLERLGAKANNWLYLLMLERNLASECGPVSAAANEDSVAALWELLHNLPMCRDCPSMPLPVVTDLVWPIANLSISLRLVRQAG